MANSQVLEIVILAVVAGVILFRLYTVLGRRTGHERPPQEDYRFQPTPDAPQPTADDTARIAPQPRRVETADTATDPVSRGIVAIKLCDRSFETEHFLNGARQAYEIIVTGFAKGDRAALKPLLSDEVYHTFDQSIAARESAKETVAFTFVGFKDTKITDATLNTNRIADVTVTFGAQFISATTSETGQLIEGDAKTVRDVTDVWTFSRDTRARDPNWMLVATSGDLP